MGIYRCSRRVRTMSATTSTLAPEEIGAALARSFQGWHVSNQSAMGRTLTALIYKHAGAGKLIAEHIATTGAVQVTPGSEPAAVSASTGNFEPLTINVRGGTAHCATTLCTVKGFVVPTNRYLRARSILISKMNEIKGDVQNAYAKPPTGSLGASQGSYGPEPPPELFEDYLSPLYRRAIDLARKVDEATNASWRDPRSRQAVAAQFGNAG